MRYVFVLSLGRSGTQSLATILDRARGVDVRHEPFAEDVKLTGLRRAGRFDRVLDDALESRFARISVRPGCEVYGEVNSYLRYESEWLRNELGASVVSVCRDGRDFVRSAYPRVVYTPRDYQMPILPDDDDSCAALWSSYSRFEKLCWYWVHTNESLCRSVGNPVRMERLLTDYHCFEREILAPLGLEVSEELWQREVARPRNTARESRRRRRLRDFFRRDREASVGDLPPWQEWDLEMTEKFWSIAGNMMEKLGYKR